MLNLKEYQEFVNQHSDDIIIKETNNFITFKYRHLGVDFNDKLMRLARGITFEKNSGELVLLGLPKFFNYDQLVGDKRYSQEEVKQLCQALNFQTDKVRLSGKLDGSMVIASYCTTLDKVQTGTTGSTESVQAKRAKQLLNSKTIDYLKENPHISLIFELIGPDNRIVIEYDKEELVLLNAMDKKTLDFVDDKLLEELKQNLGYRVPEVREYTVEELQKFVETDTKYEGFVTKNKYGNLVKIKTKDYLEKHSFFSMVNIENKFDEVILKNYIKDNLDDILSLMDTNQKLRAQELISKFNKVKQEALELQQKYNLEDRQIRKEFFLDDSIDMSIKRIVVAYNLDEAVIKYILQK